MLIGELWDLEAPSAMSERLERWTFFLTTTPMNVPGGVASPPSALAFFQSQLGLHCLHLTNKVEEEIGTAEMRYMHTRDALK
jgi:hypothetical protein